MPERQEKSNRNNHHGSEGKRWFFSGEKPQYVVGLHKINKMVLYLIPTSIKGGIMSQIQKLIDKLNSKPVPKDMTFDELARIAKYYGCDTESRGNHQRAIVHKESGTVIPIPCHDKHVKAAYVSQVKNLFASIDKEGE